MSDPRETEFRGGRPDRLDGLVARALEARGIAGLLSRAKLQTIWEEVAGDPLRRFTRVAAIEGTTLVLEVPHPTWNTSLRAMQKRLLRAMQARLPGVELTRVKVVLAVFAERAEAAEGLPEAPEPGELDGLPLPEATERGIAAMAARIDDPELRERVAAAMRRQRQLAQWRLAHGLEEGGGEPAGQP
ncbi:MAG: DUF721 domain-containing protein [Armatimonadetes bacterium]|nr:DUF721 domain-containing protein [Armatimonadota bacterium]